MKFGLVAPSCQTFEVQQNSMVTYKAINNNPRLLYLDGTVQGGTSKLVIILRIEHYHHYIVGVALKDLRTLPLLLPVP